MTSAEMPAEAIIDAATIADSDVIPAPNKPTASSIAKRSSDRIAGAFGRERLDEGGDERLVTGGLA